MFYIKSLSSEVALQWINFCSVAQKHLNGESPCKEDLLIIRIAEYVKELESVVNEGAKEISRLTNVVCNYAYAHEMNAARNLSQEQITEEVAKSLLSEKKEENV